MTKIKPLTPKQKAFVSVYNGNATESAILAGYSERSAGSIAVGLMNNSLIVRMIRAREESEAKINILSRQERQAFWSAVANDPNQKMQDRLRASELLAKSECDFTEKIEVDGNLGLNLGLVSLLKRIESGGDDNPALDAEYTDTLALPGGDRTSDGDCDQEAQD
jgi:phage terminase small subunit